MEDVFKIKTVNHTYGEVYVNAPLDRESVDRYLLKVSALSKSINHYLLFFYIQYKYLHSKRRFVSF